MEWNGTFKAEEFKDFVGNKNIIKHSLKTLQNTLDEIIIGKKLLRISNTLFVEMMEDQPQSISENRNFITSSCILVVHEFMF